MTPPPILRLPDEILVHIAGYVAVHDFNHRSYFEPDRSFGWDINIGHQLEEHRADSRASATLALISVCRRFRELYTHTAQIWRYIQADWKEREAKQFAERASPHLLTLSLSHRHSIAYLIPYFPRVEELKVDLYDDHGDWPSLDDPPVNPHFIRGIINTLRIQNIPRLRSLIICDQLPQSAGWEIGPRALSKDTCAGLTTLYIDSESHIYVHGLPRLPALRILTLVTSNDLPPDVLYSCLSGTPALERLRVSSQDPWYEEARVSQLPPLHLPAVQAIEVASSYPHVAGYIAILPIPTHEFHVCVYDEDDKQKLPVWSSSKGYSGAIMNRLVQFAHQLVTPPTTPLPGMFSREYRSYRKSYTDSLKFSDGDARSSSISRSANDTSLSYSCPVIEIAKDDPVLDHIFHVRFAYGTGDAGDDMLAPGSSQLDVRHLPNVRRLELVRTRFSSDSQNALGLEKLIETRQQEGAPFESVEFVGCSEDAKALFERLKEKTAATSIVWKD